MEPFSTLNFTPRADKPFICLSKGRGPILSPPGKGTSALPNLANKGAKNIVEALEQLPHCLGSLYLTTLEVSINNVLSPQLITFPPKQ